MRDVPKIILASSSVTRQTLFSRLNLPFVSISPDIDESPKNDQSAQDLAIRLAHQKASHVAKQYPNAIVIGSDQVAYFADQPHLFIGKPYTRETAIQQLLMSKKRTLNFATALSVQCESLDFKQTELDLFSVTFRDLKLDEITRYVDIDQPLYCAGSFKCESLGMSLFEQIKGDDFTSLMGLPLIQLCHILRALHLQIP